MEVARGEMIVLDSVARQGKTQDSHLAPKPPLRISEKTGEAGGTRGGWGAAPMGSLGIV